MSGIVNIVDSDFSMFNATRIIVPLLFGCLKRITSYDYLAKKIYFQLQIKFLVFFKPTVLFDKINQLNWYQDTLRQWVDDQGFTVNSRVLEVGCASGALTAYIANSGCIPTGVDFSNGMIEFAKIKNKGINFLVADVFDFPFETNIFDGVIAASLTNIVTDKSKAIDELSRTCKKGGTVSILVPLAGFNDKNLHLLQVSLARLRLRPTSHEVAPIGHQKNYTSVIAD